MSKAASGGRVAALVTLAWVAAGGGGSPLDLRLQWRFGIPGFSIGSAGIVVADIDRDGRVEILTNGVATPFPATHYWTIHEYDPAAAAYRIVWTSPPEAGDISALAAFDQDGDGIYSIFVGFFQGGVRVYDGISRRQVGSIATSGGAVRRVVFADADNDGAREIVVGCDTATLLCDGSTLQAEQTLGQGASDLAVGNVDGDAALEIVLATGRVLEVSGAGVTPEWTHTTSFGARIELADLDGTGPLKIVAALLNNDVVCFDAAAQTEAWRLTDNGSIYALLVVDVDGGAPEILYGHQAWGIRCRDAATRALKWTIPNPDSGVTRIAIADTDADGEREILWGSGNATSAEDIFHIYGLASRAPEWKSEHLDGPFYALDVGDADGDGNDEIVFSSNFSESGYNDGIVIIVDARTKGVEWKSPPGLFGSRAWTGIAAARIADVDGDGAREILFATDELYDGRIYVFDGTTHALKAKHSYDSLEPIRSLDVADVDGDGTMEIVAGGSPSGAGGPYVYVIDAASGAVEWQSTRLPSAAYAVWQVRVGNVDSDPALEIVALHDSITVIDTATRAQVQSGLDYTSLDLADVTGDGVPEIVVGTDTGDIAILDGETFASSGGFDTGFQAIDGVRIGDVDGDGFKDVIVTTNGGIAVYALDGTARAAAPGQVGGNAGRLGGFALVNLNGGTNLEILLGTNYGVAQFGVSTNGDSDNDGLPDDWEETYWGVGNLTSGASDDSDGDGASNQAEYQAGTDPTNATSVPPPPADSGGGGGGGCGATGFEAFAILLLARLSRTGRGR